MNLGIQMLGSRVEEKKRQREADERRLGRGDISAADLNLENCIFAALPLAQFRISAIGGRPIRTNR